jgi:hypothetical protein
MFPARKTFFHKIQFESDNFSTKNNFKSFFFDGEMNDNLNN